MPLFLMLANIGASLTTTPLVVMTLRTFNPARLIKQARKARLPQP